MQLFCWILMLNYQQMEINQVTLKSWQEAIQEENDIDVIYDKKPASPSAFEVEKAIEVLQQFTLFCDEGEDS